MLSQIPPPHDDSRAGAYAYKITTSTDPATDSPAAAITMRFRNAQNLHAAPVANHHAGCAESPFEFGWVPVDNSAGGRTVWLPANFSVTQGGSVTLTGSYRHVQQHHAALAAAHTQLDGAAVLAEVRYAWQGQPQCVLYSGEGTFENATALPVSQSARGTASCRY